MDTDFWTMQFHQFIFQLASSGPALFLGTLGITVFGLGPIGRALAARIKGGHALEPNDPTVVALKSELSELQERLDFSERMVGELRKRSGEGGDVVPPALPRRAVTPV